ncbi:hypothetical protein [Spirochaeta lutea]|uniref:Uncharacterized protein n=1 Tax=Spirochaeta lutea TaxID=1480694 RepID=A0A098QYP8_9SPIO|nr:hypothetical protein [Spirochaeta lutea]KGE71617.1 hypothetical protein DC28_10095 [Spirochaeta lutea]
MQPGPSPPLNHRRRFLVLLTILVLSGCASTPVSRRAAPIPSFPWQNYEPSLLVLARIAADTIPDTYSRVFALSRIAQEALVAQDRWAPGDDQLQQNTTQLSQGREIGFDSLQQSIGMAQEIDSALRRAELFSALSGDFLGYQAAEQALSLLKQAADLVFPLFNPDEAQGREVQILEDLIYALFNTGTAGYPLLRQAVQRIYLIQDYTLRVRLLTRTAREYQQLGSGQRAGVLLQQALAGASAIPHPADRFQAYAQIALRFQEQQDSQEALRYAEKAYSILEELAIDTLTPAQQETVRQGIQDLIPMGYAGQTGEYIQYFTQTTEQQELSLYLAEYYFEQGEPFAAEIFLQQVLQRSRQIPGPQALQTQALTTLRIAGLYLENNDPLIAQYYVEQLIQELQQNPALLDDFGKADLFVLASRLGITDAATALLARIQSGAVRASALSRALEALAQESGSQDQAATQQRQMLSDRLVATLNTLENQRDQSLLNASLALARTGQTDAALELLGTIQDPYTLSLAASNLFSIIPPGTLQPQTDRLRNLLAEWDRQPS